MSNSQKCIILAKSYSANGIYSLVILNNTYVISVKISAASKGNVYHVVVYLSAQVVNGKYGYMII